MSNSNDPGILRNRSGETEDLFVFGYASKIFRDDAKALYLDQGKHLIPWMGNETVKIDRYDARGYLSEVSKFESQDNNHFLTPEEKRIELMCDKERYFGLNKNYDELEMYQEEELKRLKQALSSEKEYGQVAYKYTESSQSGAKKEEELVNTEEQEEPFVASPFLDIPQGMVVPTTQKENHRIEKTASTVSSHGSQMEILIKIRQAANKKLGFLHVGHPLNPYYNLVLGQMKIGRYRFGNGSTNEEDNDHYLHPSLAPASSSSVECAPSIPSIAYKPSSDCVYAALVNNIKHVQQIKNQEIPEPVEPSTSQTEKPTVQSVVAPVKPSKRSRRHKIRMGPQPEPLDPEESENMKKAMAEIVSLAQRQKYDVYEALSDLESLTPVVQESTPEVDPENFYDPEKPTDDDLETVPIYSQPETEPGLVYQWPAAKMFAKDETVTGSTYSFPSQEPVLQIVDSPEPKRKKPYQILPPPPTNVPDSPKSSLSQNSPKPAPVCFSIKKPKETERIEVASVFPIEESSSEEENIEKMAKAEKEAENNKLIKGDQPQRTIFSEERLRTKITQQQSIMYPKEKTGDGNTYENQPQPSCTNVNGVSDSTNLQFPVKIEDKLQIFQDKLVNGKSRQISTDIILDKQDIKPRDDYKKPRTDIPSDPKECNVLQTQVDCKIDLDVPLPLQPLTDINCQIPTIDISTLSSADDKQPTTDEEDIVTLVEEMTVVPLHSCTQKDTNSLLAKPDSSKTEEEDEARKRKREERKRKIKEMMQKLYEKDKNITISQESTTASIAPTLLSTKHKETEFSDSEILQAESSSVTSDVTETDSSTSKCHQLSSFYKEETDQCIGLKTENTSDSKDDSGLTKKFSNSKEAFEAKLRKQVKKTLEMLKSYPKFASPHSIIEEQISTLDQTFTNLSSMTGAIRDDMDVTTGYISNTDHDVSVVLSPSYESAKKSKKSKKSKSENKNSSRKLRRSSSPTKKVSASQSSISGSSQNPSKKLKSKHIKSSTKDSSDERGGSQKSGSKFSLESVMTADDLVKSLVNSIANSSRAHRSPSTKHMVLSSSQSSTELKHKKQKKNTSGKSYSEEKTSHHKSRDEHSSESSDSSSDDSSSSSDSSSSGKKNDSESNRRRRHRSRKHYSRSHKKQRRSHKSKSKRSHKPPSKIHRTSSIHRKSRRRSRDKSDLSD